MVNLLTETARLLMSDNHNLEYDFTYIIYGLNRQCTSLALGIYFEH